MTTLFALATESGFTALSLSVERDNPAVRLYRQLGFEHRGGVDNAWIMGKRLRV